MTGKQSLSHLRGRDVVDHTEGAHIGTVSELFIDTAEKRLTAIALTPRGGGAEEYFLTFEHLKVIGPDVILASREDAVSSLEHPKERPDGKPLRALRATVVTSTQGPLGHLADFGINPQDGRINRIELSEGKCMPVTAVDISFEYNEIVVTATSAARLVDIHENVRDLITRIFSHEAAHEIAQGFRRAFAKAAHTPMEAPFMEEPVPEEKAKRGHPPL